MNEPLGEIFQPYERRAMIRRFVEIYNGPQSSVENRYALALRVRDWLRAVTGMAPMVHYGTLLGALRNQDLIPWDRDVDMVLHPQARAPLPEALRSRCWQGLDLIRVEEYLISFTSPDAPGRARRVR